MWQLKGIVEQTFVWYIAVGEQRTESGNEKQEEVEPRPNPSLYSLTAKLDLSGLK